MYYSGSPLPYSFDESDDAKCVLSIDIDCTPKQPDINGAKAPVTIERIPIISERPLKRLEGSFANFFTEHLYDEWSGCYLEITLNDAEVIAHPMQLLRQKFPFLLSIRQKSFMNQEEQEEEQLTLRERTAEDPLTLAENFNRFESLINGEQNRMKQELFEQLCKEALLNPNAD